MDFRQAVVRGLTRCVDWEGRASRSEYWWFLVFCWLCLAPGVFLTAELDFPVVVFVWAALVVPMLGVFVRRMHDTNRTGWWYFLSFVPFGIFVLLVFLCRRGDPGLNDYGPPPDMERDARGAAVGTSS